MLIAYQVALELVRELRPILDALKQHDSNLADQLQRCATSVVLNLAEGQRRQKGNKHRAYETAHGEAREVLGCLDCAQAWGWIAEDARESRVRALATSVLGPDTFEARAPRGLALPRLAARVHVAAKTTCARTLPRRRVSSRP